MKTTPVAIVGGILILAGGIALAVYTGTNAPILEATKAKSVEKYVTMSDKALAKGDLKQAEKYAKEALVVDPKNKKALSEFKKVVLASCPKSEATVKPTSTATAKPTKPKTATPAKPSDDSEEEMGCI